MTTPLSVEEYRELLAGALPEASDADTVEPRVESLFTPDTHRAALYVDSTVVRGGRGVGKTFWYRSLLNESLREVAAHEYGIERLRRVTVSQGFGAALQHDLYPGPGTLRQLVEEGVRPYDLWYAVLLTAFGQPELRELPEWRDRALWVRANPGAAERTVHKVDQEAQHQGITHLVLFDALEHLHRVRAQADRLVGGIMELALAMRLGTRSIRFKVFIRPDMYDGALLHFPDASKLTSNAAALTWSRANLYGLLFHTLGNHDSELASRFRHLTGGWPSEASGRRHVPPALLSGDEQFQAEQFTQIAGPYMGSNFRKGHTFTWLPNHLMDGVEQVSPRSFLSALQKALSETRGQYAGHEYALHHEGIRRGVQKASETRVTEVSEDMPWVVPGHHAAGRAPGAHRAGEGRGPLAGVPSRRRAAQAGRALRAPHGRGRDQGPHRPPLPGGPAAADRGADRAGRDAPPPRRPHRPAGRLPHRLRRGPQGRSAPGRGLIPADSRQRQRGQWVSSPTGLKSSGCTWSPTHSRAPARRVDSRGPGGCWAKGSPGAGGAVAGPSAGAEGGGGTSRSRWRRRPPGRRTGHPSSGRPRRMCARTAVGACPAASQHAVSFVSSGRMARGM